MDGFEFVRKCGEREAHSASSNHSHNSLNKGLESPPMRAFPAYGSGFCVLLHPTPSDDRYEDFRACPHVVAMLLARS